MSKAIERRMTLRDQVTPTMNKINKGTMKYKKNLRDLKNQGDKTWAGIKSGALGVAGAVVGIMGSVLAINKLSDAYNESVEQATKLQAIFNTTGKATAVQVNGLLEYANAVQKAGVVADDTIVAGMQQISTFNVTADTVKALSVGMADLLAQQKGYKATAQDAVNVGNMIGKVMDGQVGALSRVGISFTDAQEKVIKYGTEQEKAAALAQVLQQNVGGVNAALANTPAGKIQQAVNAFGDMQETLGGVVVTIKAHLANAFMEHLPAIETNVNAVKDAIMGWVDSGGVQRFTSNLGLVLDTLKMISPVLGAAAIAWGYYKAAVLIATIQQVGLNAVMSANPIGFIITAIAALVGAIVWMRKNWETVKITFMETWNKIIEFTELGINTNISAANAILSAFQYAGESIKYFFASMWDKIVTNAESALGALLKPINLIREALGESAINVDLSAVKANMSKPTYTQTQFIKEIEIGAKFSDDTIQAVVDARSAKEAAEEEKWKKQAEALKENTNAINGNSGALDYNTGATNSNTSALKKSSDMTGEEIADKLLPRLERFVYA